MPIRVNEIWRVKWWRPNNGIIQVLFTPGRDNGHPTKQPEYLLYNLLRERGEPRIDETYRIPIEPAFPHQIDP